MSWENLINKLRTKNVNISKFSGNCIEKRRLRISQICRYQSLQLTRCSGGIIS
jgi:hypothetical protein